MLRIINTGKVSLHFIYKGTCDKTKSHTLAIEKQMTLYFMYIYDQIMNYHLQTWRSVGIK